MYNEGKDYNQIARVTELTKEYLANLMHKKGLSKSRLVSADTTASILNDLYNESNMTLNQIAKKHNIAVIHDAAEAHGATHQNKPISDFAHITSYSTENSKHIATGDGGIVTTNDSELAKRLRKFCSLGYHAMTADSGKIRLIAKDELQDPSYKRHDSFAYNYRMPEVAAAIGLAQTER